VPHVRLSLLITLAGRLAPAMLVPLCAIAAALVAALGVLMSAGSSLPRSSTP